MKKSSSIYSKQMNDSGSSKNKSSQYKIAWNFNQIKKVSVNLSNQPTSHSKLKAVVASTELKKKTSETSVDSGIYETSTNFTSASKNLKSSTRTSSN